MAGNLGCSSREGGNGLKLVEVIIETMALNELTERDDIVQDVGQRWKLGMPRFEGMCKKHSQARRQSQNIQKSVIIETSSS